MKTKILLLMLALSTNVGFAQIPSYVPTSGLVGWWPFTGNANDQSVNSNNSVLSGPTLTTDRFGTANAAYSFNGTSDFITVLNSTSLSLMDSASFSFWMMWNGDNSIGGAGQTMIEKSTPGNIENYRISIEEPTASIPNKLSFLSNVVEVHSASTYTTLTWVHTVVTVKAGVIKIYINGILDFTGAVNLVASNTNDLLFGQSSQTGQHFFFGKLDDIGIWNRTLTQTEITNLSNSCNILITTQPINQSAVVGNNAQFSTTVTSGTATYQWQQNSGTGYTTLSNFGQFTGVTTNTLTISSVTLSQNNNGYRCLINEGGCLDTTTVAILSVSLTGITEYNNELKLIIYPNPSNTTITINTIVKYCSVKVLNTIGQTVITSGNNKAINVSSLENGIYFIQLFDEKNKMLKTEKFVKE